MNRHSSPVPGAVAPTELTEERLALHWAAQPLSAVTHAAISREEDHSHSNLGWDHDADSFLTRPFSGGQVAGLHVPGFALFWRDSGAEELDRLDLQGVTLDSAVDWLTGLVRRDAGEPACGAPTLRDYDMPPHPVADGRPFDGGDRERRLELARWYAAGDRALQDVAVAYPQSGGARTWPHHFDLGLLIPLEPDKDPEHARSIGVGLSPGDALTPQPYYYVNPYPRPQATDLPDLPSGGRWERELFFGAVLTGDALLDGGDPAAQHERVQAFLAATVEASRKLLGL